MGSSLLMKDNIDRVALRKILSRCRDLIAQSDDSDWSCMNARDIRARLDHEIQRLDDSLPVDIDELRFLFVVTGPLQETSMSNGWADEFLMLADRFDEIIGESS